MAVFTKKLRKHIFIHPGDQHKIHTAVRTVLLKDRQKYSDSMEGALLNVNNIKMIGDRHLIVNGYLSMEVMADFQVFAPTVGMTLQGYINKVHRKYCGCVTMDFFNATLSYPQNVDVVPKEGDTCSFVVESLVVNGDMLHMRGQLTSIEENQMTDGMGDINLEPEEVDDSSSQYETPKKKHKKKSKEESVTEEDDISAKKKHKKKSKEDRLDLSADDCDTSIKTEVEATDESMLENDNSAKKKHKKKLKEEKHDMSAYDYGMTSENETTNESMLENDKSPKKKHKKKSKEDQSDLSANDCRISIKSEIETTNESMLENDKSPKKKHKKKSKEDQSDLSANDCRISIKSEIETTDESMLENEKSPKKKHKKKSKEDKLHLNNDDDDEITIKSEVETIDESMLGNDKSSKKKHKKRHRSEYEDETVSEYPVKKAKKLKIEVD